jgi:hypothetical protein
LPNQIHLQMMQQQQHRPARCHPPLQLRSALADHLRLSYLPLRSSAAAAGQQQQKQWLLLLLLLL